MVALDEFFWIGMFFWVRENINMSDFTKITDNIYKSHNLYEFELPTSKFANKKIPISGGGYLRIFPWFVMKRLISEYLDNYETYFLYIHPFELSSNKPKYLKNQSLLKNFRFMYGQENTKHKLEKLIDLLQIKGFEFTTFHNLIQKY